MVEIVPAILTNDISDFRKKYAELFAASHYFTKLHVDFADGEFVGNTTIQPKDLAFLKTPLTLVAHFMTFNPGAYFEDAKRVGFKWVLFHFEAFQNDQDITQAIGAALTLGLKPGLAVNPETPLFKIAKFIGKVSLVQLMGIHPGAQGRQFIPETLDKVRELRALSKHVIISVDGGVKVGIARQCVKAGADIIVAGSAILKAEDEEAAIETLKADIE